MKTTTQEIQPGFKITELGPGLVEQWGTGTTKIVGRCRAQGLPDPVFEETGGGGFSVIFAKDPYTPERLRKMGLSERQIQAVLYVRKNGKITNTQYQNLTGIKKRQASIDLQELEEKGMLLKVGTTGRGTHYVIKEQQRGKTDQTRTPMAEQDSLINKTFPTSFKMTELGPLPEEWQRLSTARSR